jgi:hypothetical protein
MYRRSAISKVERPSLISSSSLHSRSVTTTPAVWNSPDEAACDVSTVTPRTLKPGPYPAIVVVE